MLFAIHTVVTIWVNILLYLTLGILLIEVKAPYHDTANENLSESRAENTILLHHFRHYHQLQALRSDLAESVVLPPLCPEGSSCTSNSGTGSKLVLPCCSGGGKEVVTKGLANNSEDYKSGKSRNLVLMLQDQP